MPPKPQRFCIFCGSPKVTGEHIFSEWMHSHLKSTALRSLVHSNSHPVKRNGTVAMTKRTRVRPADRPTGLRARVVCGDCNSSWMSALETEVRPHLYPLITGKTHLVTEAAQATLVKWIAMKLMVIDAFEPPTLFLDQERRKFFLTREITLHLKIYIGRAKAWIHAQSWSKSLLSVHPFSADHSTDHNVGSTTFVIDRLLIYGFYCRLPELNFHTGTPLQKRLHQIWPYAGADLHFPATGGFRDREIVRLNDALYTRLRHSIRQNQQRLVTPLRIVTPDPDDSVFHWAEGSDASKPVFTGDEFDDLVCGGCSTVLCEGVSLNTLKDKLIVEKRLLIKCGICGNHNLVPVPGTQRKRRGD